MFDEISFISVSHVKKYTYKYIYSHNKENGYFNIIKYL